ncbi:hypothetical protein [Yersinia proxima]|uniref:hypothetical protein n=2 Tax=Yersinia proxima TaxID=2890316 RepID=UPI00067886B9|nr:hypothetical protein [Yersinia proxima]
MLNHTVTELKNKHKNHNIHMGYVFWLDDKIGSIKSNPRAAFKRLIFMMSLASTGSNVGKSTWLLEEYATFNTWPIIFAVGRGPSSVVSQQLSIYVSD